MKKSVIILAVLFLGVAVFGCGKKSEPLQTAQEPVAIDTLSTMSSESTGTPASTPTTNFTPANVPTTAQAQAAPQVKLEPLPPQGPYKPTAKEIQTALKNAGFYTGTVDGKTGPKTKKAVEEFQKSKDLHVDGRVGPKTWSALSTYLNATGVSDTKQKR